MNSFEALGLAPNIVKAVTDLGFEQATPIQEQAIPVLITGTNDFVGLAQTGTGKTAAFGLPLLHLLDTDQRHTQALILAPTRELCVQISNDLVKFAKHMPSMKVVAVYGGASISNQIRDIKNGAHIIAATPGRLIDLIDRGAIKLQQVRFVVLDEADEMLNMGFKEDIDKILSETPDTKTTWLFSATMPREVRTIAERFMNKPHEISVGKKNSGNENIEHIAYVVHARDRYPALKRVVDYYPDIFCIIFCRTKMETQEIAEHLIRDGYNADSLHGDLSQQQRDKVMGRFREKALQILVATDVAARGLDVSDITHVINFNIPEDIDSYTHRSGRTARAGKKGVSIIIANMRDANKIRDIERVISKKITMGKLPSGFDVCERQLFSLVHKLHDVEVREKEIEKYMPKINEELADLSKEDIVKRFVSVEFNRFLEYYKNSRDLNVEFGRSERRDDRGEGRRSFDKADRGDRVERTPFKRGSGSSTKLFINVGKADGLDVVQLLRYVGKTARIDGGTIGHIALKATYSFFEVENDNVDQVMKSLNGTSFLNRQIRTEISGASEGSNRGERTGDNENRHSYGGGGERREGKRPRKQEKSSAGGYGRPRRNDKW